MQREAPLFPQTGGCAVHFQVSGIDHDPIRRVPFSGKASEDPFEDPATAPANKPIVEGLVWTVAVGGILPFQSVADHIDDPTDHPPVIDARFAVRTREIRFDAGHLWLVQQK
jgi:hypothetical protein